MSLEEATIWPISFDARADEVAAAARAPAARPAAVDVAVPGTEIILK